MSVRLLALSLISMKMAQCLRPIKVSVKTAMRDHPERLGVFMDATHRYKELRPYLTSDIYAPCGKCANCLKNKQAVSTLRCQQEAIERGSMTFVTLTYNDDNLPIAQSLWREDLTSHSFERLTPPELVYNSRSLDFSDMVEPVKAALSETCERSFPRYFDFDLDKFNELEPNYRYFVRLTPSISREDVRLWLKRCRVQYLREFKRELPDFSYTLASEYGGRFCRPHYHILFFGLPLKDVFFFLERWKFGFYQYKEIQRFNKDGSDAYALASRYISKYINKGSFECRSVQDGCAEKPRVCQSLRFGKGLMSDSIRDYIMCYDMFGKYDGDSLRLESGKFLTTEQVQSIAQEIPNRLTYTKDGKFRYPLPRFIRDEIFTKSSRIPKKSIVDGKETLSYQVLSRPILIWRFVQEVIQTRNNEVHDREFSEFLAKGNWRTLAEACLEFKVYSEKVIQSAEEAAEKSLIKFYQKSKF